MRRCALCLPKGVKRRYGIITALDLIKPIYTPLAAYGHMGREDLNVSWEKTDKADLLRDAAGL